jgi:hypothetical protein
LKKSRPSGRLFVVVWRPHAGSPPAGVPDAGHCRT